MPTVAPERFESPRKGTGESPGRLPDFVIVGAAKSGTTTLREHLLRHPDVFMCQPNEPCFFDANANWSRGLDWYKGLFAPADDDQLLGESSTNYTRYPQVLDVPHRIHDAIPGAQLIYIMRDPVLRTYSHFVHRWSKETHRRPSAHRIPSWQPTPQALCSNPF